MDYIDILALDCRCSGNIQEGESIKLKVRTHIWDFNWQLIMVKSEMVILPYPYIYMISK